MSANVHCLANHQPKSPQVENGFIRIANELFDALLSAPLSGTEIAVAFAIIRKTYGFNKKEDDISASQLGKICNMSRPHVTEALNALTRKNIINKRPGVHGCIVSIQKDYSRWCADPRKATKRAPHAGVNGYHYTFRVTNTATGEFYIGVRTCKCTPTQDRYLGSGNWPAEGGKATLSKTIIGEYDSREKADAAGQAQIREMIGNPLMKNIVLFVSEIDTRTDSVQGVQNMTLPCSESVQIGRPESVHTKDNLSKDKQQETKASSSRKTATEKEVSGFIEFYQAYPRKSHRKQAHQAYAKLNPDAELRATILSGLSRCKKQDQWRNPKFIPHPATWLNAGGWLDEIQTEYSTDELSVIRSYNQALGDTVGAIDEEVFSESRAAAIRRFRELSSKPEFWLHFFPWIREKADLPPRAGFDWLITAEGFSKVKGGQFNKR